MLVYPRKGSVRTIARAATLRLKMQTKLAIPPSHGILTPGQPIPTLIPITPRAWQSSHRSTLFEVTGMTNKNRPLPSLKSLLDKTRKAITIIAVTDMTRL